MAPICFFVRRHLRRRVQAVPLTAGVCVCVGGGGDDDTHTHTGNGVQRIGGSGRISGGR